jgi:hypothetical protein
MARIGWASVSSRKPAMVQRNGKPFQSVCHCAAE